MQNLWPWELGHIIGTQPCIWSNCTCIQNLNQSVCCFNLRKHLEKHTVTLACKTYLQTFNIGIFVFKLLWRHFISEWIRKFKIVSQNYFQYMSCSETVFFFNPEYFILGGLPFYGMRVLVMFMKAFLGTFVSTVKPVKTEPWIKCNPVYTKH